MPLAGQKRPVPARPLLEMQLGGPEMHPPAKLQLVMRPAGLKRHTRAPERLELETHTVGPERLELVMSVEGQKMQLVPPVMQLVPPVTQLVPPVTQLLGRMMPLAALLKMPSALPEKPLPGRTA
jgi:hypothetical protein